MIKKVGILGGGQLGRMLLQAAANYPVETFVLENDSTCPSAHLCHHFTKGDIRNFQDVYEFGKGLDAITIEIESVNLEALEQLESEGIRVYPKPAALRIIKNKILQKQFYQEHNIPTSAFHIVEDLEGIKQLIHFLPAVNKIGMGGYDGKGVQVMHQESDIDKGFDAPGVLEKMVAIHREIAQIIAINEKGETALYPPVDMVFDPQLNLLDFQVSPVELDEITLQKIQEVSLQLVRAFNSPGLFAVELFIDDQGAVYVNETAPRVHNSGHHSIEGNYSSQFDMLWRLLLEYPLGNPAAIQKAAIVNILGSEGFSGPVYYEALDKVLALEKVFVHLYGKKETKPGRKMGHVTILGDTRKELEEKASYIKQTLRVISI